MTQTKTCTRCGVIYTPKPKARDCWCSTCGREYQREWRKRNPHRKYARNTEKRVDRLNLKVKARLYKWENGKWRWVDRRSFDKQPE